MAMVVAQVFLCVSFMFMIYGTNWQKVADEASDRQSQELMLSKKLSSALSIKNEFNSSSGSALQNEGGDYFYFEE